MPGLIVITQLFYANCFDRLLDDEACETGGALSFPNLHSNYCPLPNLRITVRLGTDFMPLRS